MEAVRLIQNCWLAYLAYRTTLFQYTPTIPWTARTNINVASLNIRGGLDLFTKRSYIAHKRTSTDLDFMAIIDSNHKVQLNYAGIQLTSPTRTPRTPPGMNSKQIILYMRLSTGPPYAWKGPSALGSQPVVAPENTH